MYELNDGSGNLIGVKYYSRRDDKQHSVTGWVTSDNKFVISLTDDSLTVNREEVTLTYEAVQNILYALIINPERRVTV